MSNRVRYYITENEDRAVVRSVPVIISAEPTNDLIEVEKRADEAEKAQTNLRKPVGRIVKVLRKPASSARA